MKRICSILLSLLLVISLTGCLFGGQSETIPGGQTKAAEAETSAVTSKNAPDNDGTAAPSTKQDVPETAPSETQNVPETAEASSEQETAASSASDGPGPGTAEAPTQYGPGTAEAPTQTEPQGGPAQAETNDQIMTVTEPACGSEAWQILSKLNWQNTVWADSGDLCHLRIVDLTETGLTFYWHSRIDNYPTCFQSQLCTADFSGDAVSCDFADERGNTGVVRLRISEQSIFFVQDLMYNTTYAPTARRLTLLPRTSGTGAFYFVGGNWQDNLAARNRMYANAGGSAYQSIVNDYLENTLGITDISASMVYLLDTHTRLYTESELSGLNKNLIRLFKNEIYARHGYRFETQDVYNIFLRFTWYYPDFSAENFNENVLNQYEKENLKLLVKLEGK